ncbi:MAG: DUF3500 domain-containing protein [Planctomycetes bacterium]|nr:DUF3500 domain-containing protein [Planctomycetota bacterium]
MQKHLFVASGLVVLAAVAARVTVSSEPASGRRMLEAASTLQESLTEAQRKLALFDYASAERFNWHFIPRERKGLPLKDLSEGQRAKLHDLLRSGLSEDGFRKTQEVLELEGILGEIEGANRRFPRDPGLYFLTFFGRPAKAARWGWRFEGHHLALNFSLEGERVLSSTPVFYGANPALVRDGPRKGLRVLAGTEDAARELLKSLEPQQLKAARGEGEPQEVTGNETYRHASPLPQGLAAERLTEPQRKALLALVREYTGHLAPDLAATVEAGAFPALKGVQVAWRGGLEPGEGHSYIVHGPGFVISYANFQNGAYHVHSCLRTLSGEFGIAER